jgi:hypothetical protein
MYDAGRVPEYDRFGQPGIERHFSKLRIFFRLNSSFNIIACSPSSPGSGAWRAEREKLVQRDLKGVNIQENNRGRAKNQYPTRQPASRPVQVVFLALDSLLYILTVPQTRFFSIQFLMLGEQFPRMISLNHL